MERNKLKIFKLFKSIFDEEPDSVNEYGNRIIVEYDAYSELKVKFSDLESLKSKIGFTEMNIQRDQHRSCESCGSWGGELKFIMWDN